MVTHESFLKDVQDHSMTIENDNGFHRCLYFGRKGERNNYFRIITWPGHLAISGDMGDFVFARAPDMFGFFRGKCGEINTGYWCEKLKAISVFGGHKEFEWEKFYTELEDYLIEFNDELDADYVKEELAEAVIEEDEFGAVELMRNWFHEKIELDWGDLPSGKKFTYQYIWCLFAIVWGINKYDSQIPVTLKPGSVYVELKTGCLCKILEVSNTTVRVWHCGGAGEGWYDIPSGDFKNKYRFVGSI